MPARAPYTLLRAVLENASIAVWLLAAKTRHERVLRLLRLVWADANDRIQALGLVGGKPSGTRNEIKNELQQTARDQGLTGQQVSQVAGRAPTWTSIVESAGDGARSLSGRRALRAWTLCSGITHGRQWASLSVLDHYEPPIEDGDVVHLKLKASAEWIAVIVNIASVMVTEGWRLFDERRQTTQV